MDERVEMVAKHLQYLAEQGEKLTGTHVSFVGVAAYLNSQGIKGHKGRAQSCPVARYLAKETGIQVSVASTATSVHGSEGESLGEIRNPDAVSQFVTSFDQGSFTVLEEPRYWSVMYPMPLP